MILLHYMYNMHFPQTPARVYSGLVFNEFNWLHQLIFFSFLNLKELQKADKSQKNKKINLQHFSSCDIKRGELMIMPVGLWLHYIQIKLPLSSLWGWPMTNHFINDFHQNLSTLHTGQKALYRVAPKNGTVDFSGLCSDQQLFFSPRWIEHLFLIIITPRSSNLVENFLFYE